MAANSEVRNNKIDLAMEKLNNGIAEFFTSDKFQEYLKVMSRFHHYSMNNCILIAAQMPYATQCAGFKDWQTKFNRHVVRGEHGITIFAPSTKVYDRKTGELDEDGKEIIQKIKRIRFIPVTVFDVSQTDGAELPEPIDKLNFSVDDYEKIFDALKSLASGEVIIENIPSDANGYFSNVDNSIHIQEGMSQAQTIKTLIHELAHSRIHNAKALKDREVTRAEKEVEAESVAFIVCDHLGLDSSDYSFGYVSVWSKGKTLEELKECADVIKKSSGELINDITEKLEAISSKEVSVNLNKVKSEVQNILNENAIQGKVTDVIAYSEKDNKTTNPDKMNILIFSESENRMNLCVQGDREKVTSCLKEAAAKDPYFDTDALLNALKENGYTYSTGSVNSRNIVYDLGYDSLTNTFHTYTKLSADKSVKVISCIDSIEKEDVLFDTLQGSSLQIDGTDIEINTVLSAGIESWSSNYIERIDRYDMEGKEPVIPKVEVLFSNFNNPIQDNEMELYAAVDYFNSVRSRLRDTTDKFIRVKISYVRNDWNYESVQDIGLSSVGENFIDTLHLPQTVISHLKNHYSLAEMEDSARNFSPGTDYGSMYSDKVEKWSKYCCIELNHNSDNPVIPRPPEINEFSMVLNNDWELGR